MGKTIGKPLRSKWLPHVGVFKVHKDAQGNLRLRGPHSGDGYYMGDTSIIATFVWLGRYLALKGKLPRHVQMDELAVKSNSVAKGIRTVIATEHFAALTSKGCEKDG